MNLPFCFHSLLFLLFVQGPLLAQNFAFTELGLVGERGTLFFGMGVSCVDFTGDGWDDLTIGTAAGLPLLFFENDGEGGFIPLEAPIENDDAVRMVLWVDYDNDGDRDLYLTCYEAPNRLYRNNGNLNLEDVTEAAGFSLFQDRSWGAAWGDFDNDGWLDLYYTNRDASEHTNYFYRNLGDGTFQDITEEKDLSDGLRLTFCANFLDINQDGLAELYLANDKIFPNTMWLNKGNGIYSNISGLSGTGFKIDAMNIDAADYDNDGDLDIYVTNTPDYGNILLRNNGNETYTDVAAQAGVRVHAFCWAGLFGDYDNDRNQDLYVCNLNAVDSLPNLLLANQGDGTFATPFPGGFPGDTLEAYAAALGDFDLDGRLDLVVPHLGDDPIKVWYNQSNSGNHWLKIQLEGVYSNRDGIGSWIEVYTPAGKLVRYTHCGQTYLGQNSLLHHIGLGNSDSVDSLVVRWPSGIISQLTELAVDTSYLVVEGMVTEPLGNTTVTPDFEVGMPFPNPTDNEVRLTIRCPRPEWIDATILDAAGRQWAAFSWQQMPGLSEKKLMLPPDLPNGSYILSLHIGTFRRGFPLIIE